MATSVLDVLPSLNGHGPGNERDDDPIDVTFAPKVTSNIFRASFFFAYKVVSQLITIFEKHGWGSVSICF